MFQVVTISRLATPQVHCTYTAGTQQTNTCVTSTHLRYLCACMMKQIRMCSRVCSSTTTSVVAH